MRALLVVNPQATSTSDSARDVITQALSGVCKVDVAVTSHRGHASELAAAAGAEGYGAVVVHGGDGTVNEVVNGLMATRTTAGVSAAEPYGDAVGRPSLAIVPGGSTNVFARVVGYPADPIEATGTILDALRHRRRRTVGLGLADDRWFTFCAGIGYDAEVVARVERHRAGGRRSTHALYLRCAVTQFFTGTQRRDPALTVRVDDEEPIEGIHLAIVCNTTPWTFLDDRPIEPCPDASFDTGLDLLAPTSLRTATMLRHSRQLLAGVPPRGPHLVTRHDAATITLTASRPMAFQLDGDHLGDIESVTLRAVPHAIDVVV